MGVVLVFPIGRKASRRTPLRPENTPASIIILPVVRIERETGATPAAKRVAHATGRSRSRAPLGRPRPSGRNRAKAGLHDKETG